MNAYEEVMQYKNYWINSDGTFVIDEEWIIERENPSIGSRLEWKEVHLYRTLTLYFYVSIQKFSRDFRNLINYRGEYSVIVSVAEAGMPHTLEQWGDPWKRGHSLYVDPFVAGRLYKDVFEYHMYEDTITQGAIPAALAAGFETLDGAEQFAQKWKLKLVDDFKDKLKMQNKLMEEVKQCKE